MDSKLTNFGVHGRRASLLALIAIVNLFGLSNPAQAQARPQFPDRSDNHVMQAGAVHNGPIFSQPGLQPNVTHPSPADGLIQLWPSPITYSRIAKFMQPYLHNDLRFGVRYTYDFKFSLSARDAKGKSQPIPDGRYLLNMAVLLQDVDSIYKPAAGVVQDSPYDRYVTSTTLLVLVTNGQFSRKITLNFPNVTATTLMNHLYIELIPLKEDCQGRPCIKVDGNGQPDVQASQIVPLDNYKSFLVEMPFVPFVPSGAAQPNPDDAPETFQKYFNQTLGEFIHRAQIHQAKKSDNVIRARSAKEFADQTKALYLTTRDSRLQNHLRAWIKDKSVDPARLIEDMIQSEGVGLITLDNKYRALLPAFCEILNQVTAPSRAGFFTQIFASSVSQVHYQIIRDCEKNPHKYLHLSRVVHMGSIDRSKKITRLVSRNMSFNMMANFMVNRSRSKDTFTTWNFKPLKPFFAVVEAFGVDLSGYFDYTHSVNETNSRSESESVIGSLSTLLDFNINALRVPTVGSTQCLLVTPVINDTSVFIDRREGSQNGLYICDDKARNIDVSEIYLHAFERGRDTSTVDAFDPLTQTVNFSLRGDRDISSFFYLIRKNVSPNHDNKVLPFEMLKDVESHFANTPISYPKTVITSLAFERQMVPSFWDMAMGPLGTYKETFINDK